ncbi:MAG: stage III sporulation protein AG [Clostridiales bacterium]|nr:stage III sporulation protein AG [Clostridiales bacterium]
MKQWLENLKDGKKDQILILLLFGILLVVIAWPAGSGSLAEETGSTGEQTEAGSSQGKDSEETAAAAVSSNGTDGISVRSTEEVLEKSLEDLLSQVEGVGQAKVLITLKSDGKKVVEKDTQQSDSTEESGGESESSSSEQTSGSETTIYEKNSDGSEIPYVTEQLSPEILGVLVIAQGADSSAVVTEITEAVMALFGIEAHKIKVMKME